MRVIATLLLSMLLLSEAWGSIGTITELRGAVTISRSKQKIEATQGFKIEQNDQLEAKNGRAKITFIDNTVVEVTEHSRLVIDDFVFDPKNAQSSKIGIQAAQGTVRYISGNIAKNNPSNVKINTPSSAISVRGTDFMMSVNEIGGSLVVLLPDCDVSQAFAKGTICANGSIEVDGGGTKLLLTSPFEATMVESAGNKPSQIINVASLFSGAGSANIETPRSLTNISLLSTLRASMLALGFIKNSEAQNREKEESKVASDDNSRRDQDSKEEENSKVVQLFVRTKNSDIESSTSASTSESEFIRRVYSDRSETKQIGWAADSLSQPGKNYSLIVLPNNTQIQVTVTQDMITNSYNFSSGKAQGTISVTQNQR